MNELFAFCNNVKLKLVFCCPYLQKLELCSLRNIFSMEKKNIRKKNGKKHKAILVLFKLVFLGLQIVSSHMNKQWNKVINIFKCAESSTQLLTD